jgi:hypothetical protein
MEKKIGNDKVGPFVPKGDPLGSDQRTAVARSQVGYPCDRIVIGNFSHQPSSASFYV